MVGPAVMKGDPVIPQARFYPEDIRGAEGVMLMFNGTDWDWFGAPEATGNHRYPPEDIAPVGDTRGLIFYRLTRFGQKQGKKSRSDAIYELFGRGAHVELSHLLICEPVGVPAHARNPLRIIGTTGGADVSSLASRTALTAFAPGPINAVDPDPFPAPQVRTYSYSTTTDTDWGGPSWGTVKSFLVSTTVEAFASAFPEAGAVDELTSVAGKLTQDAYRLIA